MTTMTPTELSELSECELSNVCGGEVGQISQAISHWEFGEDPPRMAIRWAGSEANAMYDEGYVKGIGDVESSVGDFGRHDFEMDFSGNDPFGGFDSGGWCGGGGGGGYSPYVCAY